MNNRYLVRATLRSAASAWTLLSLVCSLVLPCALTANAQTSPSTPTVPTVSITRFKLTTNDLAYDAKRNLLYASVISNNASGIAYGNSVVPIILNRNQIGAPLFVGSEPSKLALSKDNNLLYVGLDGAGAVRRVDLNTYTATREFTLGNSDFGAFVVNDMEVLPGNPEVIAVSRRRPEVSPSFGGVAIYDSGVRRPTTTPDHTGSDFIAFGDSPTRLYGNGGGGFARINVTESGVQNTGPQFGNPSVGSGDIVIVGGLAYFRSGQVAEAETGTLIGTFSGVQNSSSMVVDASVDRVYFLTRGDSFSSTAPVTLRAFDRNTFVPLGSITIPNITGNVSSLVRWGANGFAFRTQVDSFNNTNQQSNQVVVLQTSLVPSSLTVTNSDVTIAPPVAVTPSAATATIKEVALATKDLVYNKADSSFYASVPSSAGQNGNSITPLDPVTGVIGTSVFVGSEPGKLALSDDGSTIYVALDGAAGIRRFDTRTRTPGIQFGLGNTTSDGQYFAGDLAVMPGNPNAVLIARRDQSGNARGVALYENGVQRGTATSSFSPRINQIEYSNDPNIAYGINTSDTGFDFSRLQISSSGVTIASTTRGIGGGFSTVINYEAGLLYYSNGRVLNPETLARVGTYVLSSSPSGSPSGTTAVAADAANGRVYLLTGGDNFSNSRVTARLRAYDMRTFRQIGFIDIPNVTGAVGSLVRWGNDGLAFRTTGGQVFFIQSLLVNPLQTTINITNPTAGARVGKSFTLNLTAEVNIDGRATIARVEFYAGSRLIGTATSAPYTISVRSLLPGVNYIVARVIDNNGNVTESAPVFITNTRNTYRSMRR